MSKGKNLFVGSHKSSNAKHSKGYERIWGKKDDITRNLKDKGRGADQGDGRGKGKI